MIVHRYFYVLCSYLKENKFILGSLGMLMPSVLGMSEIVKLLNSSPPIVEGYIDLAYQLQPAGFDLSLAEVRQFKSSGQIDFDNTKRLISETYPLKFSLEDESIKLNKGTYLIVFNEKINLPKNILALGFPRSTLLRCGVTINSAVWDPGYSGRGRSLMMVLNSNGVKLFKNARVMQLIFIKVEGDTGEGYKGVYKGEK
ncbi:MAG: deoxyuridine 5'-triphosphate nucleotidohydrolase [Thermoprotei archaeon]|nr:MAG: deoxyuridine 5'-triphosphate nucleotidohydrolase [Thermoprotei archaeon]